MKALFTLSLLLLAFVANAQVATKLSVNAVRKRVDSLEITRLPVIISSGYSTTANYGKGTKARLIVRTDTIGVWLYIPTNGTATTGTVKKITTN